MQVMTREEKLNYIASHYMNAMWQKAYSVLSDAHEAEDCCQEAFIKLMKVADSIEDVTELRARALCSVVARNTAIDMARKNGRMSPSEDIYMDLEAMDQQEDSPEQLLDGIRAYGSHRGASGGLQGCAYAEMPAGAFRRTDRRAAWHQCQFSKYQAYEGKEGPQGQA